MQQQALSVIVAWTRLEKAMAAYELDLRRRFGVTALQLSVLALCAERPQLPLAALRRSLVMHAATLGQAIDALRRMDLVTVRTDPRDRRARMVGLTEKGVEVVKAAPLAGTARLRLVDADPAALDRLADSLDEAVTLFGLEVWLPSGRD